MLQSMRHLAQSWFFKGLMMILIISFGIWGIGDIFRGNPAQRKVATVGDTVITVQELQHDFDENLARARQTFGADLNAQQAKQMGLLDHTLDIMAQRAAVDQEIKRLGINVTDKILLDRLAAQPQFRDAKGNFNTALFRQLLAQQNMSESAFLKEGRQDLMRQQVLDLFDSRGNPPDTILNALYQARGQKRFFQIVTITNDSFDTIAAPDDKTLQDYYHDHQKAFMAPEYRAVTIARLSTDDLTKGITIDDQQLHQAYDTRGAQLAQPERRDFLQVVVQNEDKARQLAIAARSANGLTAAAKQGGYDAVPINQAEEKDLPPELAKIVFGLPAGQIAEPVHTSLGWHVIQLAKITPAGKPDFEAVKNDLRESLRRDQAVEAATHIVNQMDDQLAAGHSLEDIADTYKLRLVKIPAVDQSGKTPDGKDPGELPNKDASLKAAFSQGAGETGSILDDQNGNYFVVRTDDITPAALKPFDVVKSAVLAGWKANEESKLAAAAAEKVAAALRNGKPVTEAAGANGKAQLSKPISMLGDNDPSVPTSILPQIMKLNKGEVTIVPFADKQMVFQLVKFADADAMPMPVKAKLSSELKTHATKDLTDEYVKYLQRVFPARINQDALDLLQQQGG